MAREIQYPAGPADVQSTADAATVAITITDQVTIIDHATMSQDTTFNATIDDGVRDGALLYIKATSDGSARQVTLGTNLDGNADSGAINKTKYITLVKHGSSFKHIATQQID